VNATETVASLQNEGISTFIYPLTIQLSSPHRTSVGAFEFALTGPPGVYTVLATADLATWSILAPLTNELGSAVFTDATAKLVRQKFYRVRSP
jgi:hypothetical protein